MLEANPSLIWTESPLRYQGPRLQLGLRVDTHYLLSTFLEMPGIYSLI